MATLRLIRPERSPGDDGSGTWGELVAWFSELVICLDRGDLAGAVEAQEHIQRYGFRITFRRPTAPKLGGGR